MKVILRINEPENISKTIYIDDSSFYVEVDDEKYNIDGYYISDPTWDNDLTHDYYNHLAMTDNEQANTRRYMYLNDMDIFNVNNRKEEKNFLL